VICLSCNFTSPFWCIDCWNYSRVHWISISIQPMFENQSRMFEYLILHHLFDHLILLLDHLILLLDYLLLLLDHLILLLNPLLLLLDYIVPKSYYSHPSLLRTQKIFNILSYYRQSHNNKKLFIKKIFNKKVKIIILM
jgi:hypothetical protein